MRKRMLLKKLQVTLIVFAVLCVAEEAFPASGNDDKENGKDSVAKTVLKTITKPVKAVLGSVINLEPIVMSSDRTEQPASMSANSITVISEKDIAEQHMLFMKDILTEAADVSKTETGTFGGTTGVRIRGSNPNHTLLMIDNVKVYDPSSASGGFNFAHLPFDNVSQIEVLRGPQSTIYGSAAIGGVISVVSKKPEKPFFKAKFETGSYWTFDESVQLGSYEKGFFYSLAFSQLNTGGDFKGGYILD